MPEILRYTGDPATAGHDVIVAADEAVAVAATTVRLRDELEAAGGRAATWRIVTLPPGEPRSASVDAVAAVVRATRRPFVVGLGGGSALDTSKQAAVVAADAPGVIAYALGARPLPVRRAPLVVVPTTAGTGSEVTRTCVVSDGEGRKLWTWGAQLLPDAVVLDPLATATMPPHITAATGLDAFVHAVEAVTGRRTSADVAAPASRAVRLVRDHLPLAVADGDDLDARRAMQQAAMLAGLAIDEGGTGIAHAVGHALGSLAHVPHGVAVAVGLGAALGRNVTAAPDAFAAVAAAMGVAVKGVPDAYRELVDACALGGAVRRAGPLALDPAALADALVAPENVPMHDNNCWRPDDAGRRALAVDVLALWDELLVSL